MRKRQMKRVAILTVTATLLLTGLVLSADGASTPLSTGYGISWCTVDGGGGTSSEGAYTVTATVGQPDAGTMSGED